MSSLPKSCHLNQGVETLYNCSVFCQFKMSLDARFEHVLPCRKTTQQFLRDVSPILASSQLLSQKFVIRAFAANNTLVRFALTLSTSEIYVVKECIFCNRRF